MKNTSKKTLNLKAKYAQELQEKLPRGIVFNKVGLSHFFNEDSLSQYGFELKGNKYPVNENEFIDWENCEILGGKSDFVFYNNYLQPKRENENYPLYSEFTPESVMHLIKIIVETINKEQGINIDIINLGKKIFGKNFDFVGDNLNGSFSLETKFIEKEIDTKDISQNEKGYIFDKKTNRYRSIKNGRFTCVLKVLPTK